MVDRSWGRRRTSYASLEEGQSDGFECPYGCHRRWRSEKWFGVAKRDVKSKKGLSSFRLLAFSRRLRFLRCTMPYTLGPFIQSSEVLIPPLNFAMVLPGVFRSARQPPPSTAN